MLEVELIAEYLLENSYVSSERDAYEFIPYMSDEWLSSILEECLVEESSLFNLIMEMRKQDKVAGKEKTPLRIPSDKKRVKKTPEGGLQVTRDKDVLNPYAALGRAKQGMPMDPESRVKNHRAYLVDPKSQIRHRHGGSEPGVEAGSARGVKKKRGAKYRERGFTPVELIKQRLEAKKRRKAEQGNRYGNRSYF
jgi:hypothetical protein